MTRKTLHVTIKEPGRDEGKIFLITEMSAGDAEDWAWEAFLALARGGVEVPEGIQDMGIAGIATLGLKAFGGMRFQDAKPLLDRMMECVQICPDSRNRDFARHLVDNDIEEISTRFSLRLEAFQIHINFSMEDAPLSLMKVRMASSQ